MMNFRSSSVPKRVFISISLLIFIYISTSFVISYFFIAEADTESVSTSNAKNNSTNNNKTWTKTTVIFKEKENGVEEELMKHFDEPDFEMHMSDFVFKASQLDNEEKNSINVTLTPPPEIVHFHAYPQSGATHIMYLVQHATQKTCAMNYGHVKMNPETGVISFLEKNEMSVLLYHTSASPALLSPELDLPSKYILTRTQGDSFCVYCHPRNYVSNLFNFEQYSNYFGTVQLKGGTIHEVRYDPELIKVKTKKVIHLYKDPFMNVVSRFRGAMAKAKRQRRYHLVSMYPDTREGFQKWCNAADKNFYRADSKTYPKKVWKLTRGISCRQEFFKYIQWHNHSVQLTKKLKLAKEDTVLNVHYQDLKNDQMKVIHKISDFLEQDVIKSDLIDSPLETKNAMDYFTNEQIDQIKFFLKKMAIREVWEQIEQNQSYRYVREQE